MVLATRQITTLAGRAGSKGSQDGSLGSYVRFWGASGLWSDGQGGLWIADTYNHTIRKMTVSSGGVTTIAGAAGMAGFADGVGTETRFNEPSQLSSDGQGGLFVADNLNHVVRRFDIASATVTTVVGSAADSGVLLGLLPARLNHPQGVAYVSQVGLFIVDFFEHCVLLADL